MEKSLLHPEASKAGLGRKTPPPVHMLSAGHVHPDWLLFPWTRRIWSSQGECVLGRRGDCIWQRAFMPPSPGSALEVPG